ncbi:MAG: hypothetical protein JWO70_1742 [Betaproteobacteria bacterium]|jgi:hypothetical protein|nr:hypothetical protein [Betaproteobacteria bacterium]
MTFPTVTTFRAQARGAMASPRARLIAIVLIVIVPGGLVVPACYAIYQAIRHTLTR